MTESLHEIMRDAVEWRLAGLLLERPGAGWAGEVSALAAESGGAAAGVARQAAQGAREEDYLAVLGPGGPVSPREAAHRGTMDPGSILADLEGFYRAFAYRPRAEDPPDHLALELGFAGYLRLKEAFAWSRNDVEGAAVTREARDEFIRAHLGPFARSFAHRLAQGDAGYLAGLTELLEARFGRATESELDPAPVLPGAGPIAGASPCGASPRCSPAPIDEDLHPELEEGCGGAS